MTSGIDVGSLVWDFEDLSSFLKIQQSLMELAQVAPYLHNQSQFHNFKLSASGGT